jgi:hypothetical protein
MVALKPYNQSINMAQLDPWGIGKYLIADRPQDFLSQYQGYETNDENLRASRDKNDLNERNIQRQKTIEDALTSAYGDSEKEGKPLSTDDMLAKAEQEYLRQGDAETAMKLADQRENSSTRHSQSMEQKLQTIQKLYNIDGDKAAALYDSTLSGTLGPLKNQAQLQGGHMFKGADGAQYRILGDGTTVQVGEAPDRRPEHERQTVFRAVTLYGPHGEEEEMSVPNNPDGAAAINARMKETASRKRNPKKARPTRR